jgi:hypothetical protein
LPLARVKLPRCRRITTSVETSKGPAVRCWRGSRDQEGPSRREEVDSCAAQCCAAIAAGGVETASPTNRRDAGHSCRSRRSGHAPSINSHSVPDSQGRSSQGSPLLGRLLFASLPVTCSQSSIGGAMDAVSCLPAEWPLPAPCRLCPSLPVPTVHVVRVVVLRMREEPPQTPHRNSEWRPSVIISCSTELW